MSIEVNGRIIETDEEGFLLNPDDWDEDVAEALVRAHEAAGHKPVTETGWELIRYFREYYEAHQVHPTMHKLLAQRARLEGKPFHDEESYRDFLYELFPHGPIPMLCKLAGLPNPSLEVET
ncbi:MAG TPA: TusE/DsrC/DsvC family sulfur relay protein [Gammaproteobacteria bacterium]|nr:TusE/DsrC/DsvC family sulfur relay protein [Gammaproteobacteria bacterium]